VHEVMHKNPPTLQLRGFFHSTLIMTLLFKTLRCSRLSSTSFCGHVTV